MRRQPGRRPFEARALASACAARTSEGRSWNRADVRRGDLAASNLLRDVHPAGVDEQLVERALLAHDALLEAVAPQRLEVLAVAFGQAELPRIGTEDRDLLLKRVAHPGERHIARIEDAPVGDVLGLVERLHQVVRHPGMALDDL